MCPTPHFFDFTPNPLKSQADKANAEQKKIEQEQQRQRIEAFAKTSTYQQVTQDLTNAFENIAQKLQASAQAGRYGVTLIDYRGEPSKCCALKRQYEAFKQQIKTPGVELEYVQPFRTDEIRDPAAFRCSLYVKWDR